MIYLDDIEQGLAFSSGRRTVTETDVVNFSGFSGDYSPLHTDEIYIREMTSFGGRIAHGQLVAAITSGLPSQLDMWYVVSYRSVKRSFVNPVYPGDTIWASYIVRAVRASGSAPGAGVVRMSVEVRNQSGGIVQTGEDVVLVGGRTSDSASNGYV